MLKLARALSARAIERMGELIESKDERVAVVAANAVLDRALGKPRLAQEEKADSLEAERLARMSDAERLAWAADIAEKARALLHHISGSWGRGKSAGSVSTSRY